MSTAQECKVLNECLARGVQCITSRLVCAQKRINITSTISLVRMINKIRKDKRMINQNRKNKDISLRTIEAAESVKSLIHSLTLSLEEKITMEDQINDLLHENNCLLDIISNSKKDYQKKLFHAYLEFLERTIDAVNERMDEL